MRRLILWAPALMLVGLVGRTALAQDRNDTSKAEETFLAGRELLKDKRYAEACAKFEQSEAQDPASGTLLALAYCQELSGRFATSWASYGAAAELAAREGHPERQTAARERAQALASRVSRLTVLVPAELLALPGFHLTRNGAEFERASFGVPAPLDGGTHVFTASAPGHVTWTSTVTLAAENDQKTLALPKLDAAESSVALPAAKAADAPLAAPVLLAPVDTGPDLKLRRVSLALAAGSVAGLGLGMAFVVAAKSKNDDSNADNHCDSRGCDPQGVQLRNDSLSAARVATWSFVASGALAAASISLYVASTRSHAGANAAKVQANVLLSARAILLTGSF